MLNEQQQKALDLVSAACAQRPLPDNVRTGTQLRPRHWFLVTGTFHLQCPGRLKRGATACSVVDQKAHTAMRGHLVRARTASWWL